MPRRIVVGIELWVRIKFEAIMKKVNNKFLSLSKKALITTLIIILPIIIIFVWSYKTERTILKKNSLSDLQIIAEAYEGQIYYFLNTYKQRARDFASDGYIRSKLKEILQGNSSAATALNNHLIRNKIVLDKHMIYIDIVSLSGKVIASTKRSHLGKNFSKAPFFIKLRKTPNKTSVEINMHDTPTTLEFSTLIMDIHSKKIIGILVNDYSLSFLNQVLSGQYASYLGAKTQGQGRRESFEIYLVNQNKLFLTESRFIKNAVLNQIVNTKAVNACLNSNIETTGFYKDYRGIEVAGASMCFPKQKWVLLAEIDASEALAPIHHLLTRMIIGGLIVIILMILSLLLILRYIIKPLRSMSDAASQIANGKYDIKVPVLSSDEMGNLSHTFNEMTAQLQINVSALAESKDLLAEAQKITHLGCWSLDLIHNKWQCSDELSYLFSGAKFDITNFTHEEIINFIHPEDKNIAKESAEKAIRYFTPTSLEYRIILSNDRTKTMSEHIEIINDSNGNPIRVLGVIQDITKRKQTELKLIQLSTAIEQSVNLVMIVSNKGIIEYVNPAFEKTTGYSSNEIIGQRPSILSSGKTSDTTYKTLWDTIKHGRIWRGTLQDKRKDGKLFWVNSTISPIKNNKGEITHYLSIQEDITEKKEAEEQTDFLVQHDALTGLNNRFYFLKLLDLWLSEPASKKKTGVLFFIGIDQFKLLNDTYGHGMGDHLLKCFGEKIKIICSKLPDIKNAKEKSITARLGGDEFGVFLPMIDETKSIAIAQSFQHALKEIPLKDLDYQLTVSIGLCCYPKDGTDAKTLMSKADLSMFRAKDLGRNRIHVFTGEDHTLEKLHSRLSWKNKILKALDEDRFEPWFQPILEIKSNEVHHYEALARLRDHEGKIILPGAFIDVAERFGIIHLIDKMIISKTLQVLKEFELSGKKTSFAMNLSGHELSDKNVLNFLISLIQKYKVDPKNIIFEITETVAIQNMDLAIEFIKPLKELGCKFSLDDFGVGFTSFAYLEKFQVDYIKIDGFFIRELDKNANDQLFVKAIADVATGMGIKTIAEFVETEAVLKLLKTFGVDYAQGYFVGKPAPKIIEK